MVISELLVYWYKLIKYTAKCIPWLLCSAKTLLRLNFSQTDFAFAAHGMKLISYQLIWCVYDTSLHKMHYIFGMLWLTSTHLCSIQHFFPLNFIKSAIVYLKGLLSMNYIKNKKKITFTSINSADTEFDEHCVYVGSFLGLHGQIMFSFIFHFGPHCNKRNCLWWMPTTKMQTSLRTRAVWSAHLQFPFWKMYKLQFMHASLKGYS